jgi:hypothetical protein
VRAIFDIKYVLRLEPVNRRRQTGLSKFLFRVTRLGDFSPIGRLLKAIFWKTKIAQKWRLFGRFLGFQKSPKIHLHKANIKDQKALFTYIFFKK